MMQGPGVSSTGEDNTLYIVLGIIGGVLCLILCAALIGYLLVKKNGKLSADDGAEHAGTSLDYMYIAFNSTRNTLFCFCNQKLVLHL